MRVDSLQTYVSHYSPHTIIVFNSLVESGVEARAKKWTHPSMKTLSDIFTSLQLSQRDAQLLLDKLQDYDSAGAPNSVHQVYAEEEKRIKDVHGLFTKAIDLTSRSLNTRILCAFSASRAFSSRIMAAISNRGLVMRVCLGYSSPVIISRARLRPRPRPRPRSGPPRPARVILSVNVRKQLF